jgi:hypothetical protein
MHPSLDDGTLYAEQFSNFRFHDLGLIRKGRLALWIVQGMALQGFKF